MDQSRKFFVLLIISILYYSTPVSAADTETDFNITKNNINAIQVVNPNLPNVPQQKGQIGEILSKLFDSNGKIGNWYLKALGSREDGAVLRWAGGEGGGVYDRINLGHRNKSWYRN